MGKQKKRNVQRQDPTEDDASARWPVQKRQGKLAVHLAAGLAKKDRSRD